jgi:hypothetical protein
MSIQRTSIEAGTLPFLPVPPYGYCTPHRPTPAVHYLGYTCGPPALPIYVSNPLSSILNLGPSLWRGKIQSTTHLQPELTHHAGSIHRPSLLPQ